MNVEKMRDILIQLFPGRSISVDQDAWYQSHLSGPDSTYCNFSCNIFKLPKEPGHTSIIYSGSTKDIGELFIEVCCKMVEYEAKLKGDQ